MTPFLRVGEVGSLDASTIDERDAGSDHQHQVVSSFGYAPCGRGGGVFRGNGISVGDGSGGMRSTTRSARRHGGPRTARSR